MARIRERTQIGDAAEDVGILDDHARRIVVDLRDQPVEVHLGHQPRVGRVEHVAGELGHRVRHRHVMRVKTRRQDRLAALGDATRHHDRFPARGRAVVHRRVGDVGAEQPRDLRLELEQHLQRALRDLWLVRRVGGQELAALDQVIDAGGNMMLVRAATEEKRGFTRGEVLLGECGHVAFDRHFGGVHRQVADGAVEAGGLGNVDEEIIDRRGADDGEHRLAVGLGQGKVAHSSLLPSRSREGSGEGMRRGTTVSAPPPTPPASGRGAAT